MLSFSPLRWPRCKPDTPCLAGDLATVFMLEDRVTARTDAGQDCLSGSPSCIPNTIDSLAKV